MVMNSAILVVEDDEALRDVFSRSLQRAGFDVLTAAHGKEALAVCRKGGIGLVLTDIMMPVLNGFELIRALKSEAPGTPVIAVSNSGIKDVPDFGRHAVELGAAVAVRKPVNPHALVRLVREFIDTGRTPLARH
jgi:CheY-like chemotaxis protein